MNASGIKSHMHVHYREDRLKRQRGQNPSGQGSSPPHSPRHRSRSPSCSPRHRSRSPMRSPSPPDAWDDLCDEDFERYGDFGDVTPPTSTPHSPDLPAQQEPVEPEEIKLHEQLNGESRLYPRSTVGQKTAPMFECFGKVGMV